MKNPWFKFYPQDWLGDECLSMCSLSAQGLWVRMMCIMHKSNPYGFLLVNGQPLTNTQLARLTGESVEQINQYMTELQDAGVFSVDGKGRIYSRRMVGDAKKAHTARKNGKSGGNPKLCNKRQKKPLDNPKLKGAVKGRVKAQIPDTRYQNNKSYWVDGHVIRLTKEDYESWLAIYPGNGDMFDDWLANRDVWLSEQPAYVQKGWFISTSKAIQQLQPEEA